MVNTLKFALDSIIIFNKIAFVNTNVLLVKIISKNYNFLLNVFPGEQSVLFFIQLHYLLNKKIEKKSYKIKSKYFISTMVHGLI